MNEEMEPRVDFYAHERGCVQLKANAEWGDIKDLMSDLQAGSETADVPHVEAYIVPWAGTYELLMAVGAAAAGLGSLGVGAAAVLQQFAKKNPSQPVTIHMDGNSRIVISGDLTASDTAKVNAFFDSHSTSPIEAGTNYGPGLVPMEWAPPK